MKESLPTTTDFPAPVDGRPDLLIIAGEHSGDEHAALLLADLRAKRPDLKVACLGGVELQAAGAQLLYDLTAVSIVGFVEVVRHYNFFKSLFDRTLEWIERYQPRHICFVDYPGFNLRLAEQLAARGLSKKGGGAIGLSYYVSPQVWAWKAKRRFKMGQLLDRLGVIFPFEIECFADTELPTEFVGHPFVRTSFEPPFSYDAAAPALLLPGSRSAAVGRIFPLLLAGFREARKTKPELKARVVYPSQQILAQLEVILAAQPDLAGCVSFSPNTTERLPASAVLMSSGTMSLACALSTIPGAIAYRLNPMSYWLGRILVKVKYIGIANLLLDRPLHPEYIQNAASPRALGRELLRALDDPRAAEEAAKGAAELRDLLHAESDATAAEWLARGLDHS
jgi:lipid-A-disaccharide synthase